MTAKEFDRLWDALGDWVARSRLRFLASIVLVLCCFAAAIAYLGTSSADGQNLPNYDLCTYTKDGVDYYQPNGYHPSGVRGHCDPHGTLVRSAPYGGHPLKYAEILLLIGVSGFGLAVSNDALLFVRRGPRKVRIAWRDSATRRAMTERDRRKKAEVLSDAAEKETARLHRQLEEMGAYPS